MTERARRQSADKRRLTRLSLALRPLFGWRRAAAGLTRLACRIGWRVGLLAVVCFANAPAHADEPVSEDRIKAAIVYKVGKFVDWPDSAFAGPDAPLQVCLLGDDGLAEALSSLAGRRVQGRRMAFKVVADARPSRSGDCHILFVPRSAAPRSVAVARLLEGAPVLTVSDIPGFARSGGMIALVRTGDRLGFQIAPQAARRSGLAVRAQLLDLAEIVGDD